MTSQPTAGQAGLLCSCGTVTREAGGVVCTVLHCCVLKCYRQIQVLRVSVAFPGFPKRRHVYRPVRQVRPDLSATTRPAEVRSAFDGRPMEECLRSACPCLEALWLRVFGEKRDPPTRGVESQPPPSPSAPDGGSLYTAVWGFESRHPDELSFHRGDLFAVLTRDGDWWTAQKVDSDGRVLDTGIVPANYLAHAGSLESQR